jgi:biopolymer transport protein ExbD
MAFAQKNDDDEDDFVSEINLTPLIDVMLVLLIIFMVSTSVAVDTGLKINLPKGETVSSTLDSDSIVIAMDAASKMTVNGKLTSLTALNEDLKSAILKEKTGIVIFKGDKTVGLEVIIKVMDISNRSGATKFALALDQG